MRIENRLRDLLAIAVLMISVGACDAVSGRETVGEYIDDTAITSQVIAQIVKEPTLSKSQVSVETLQNVVQLSGFVDSRQDVAKAEQLARGVTGVRSVRNDLTVR